MSITLDQTHSEQKWIYELEKLQGFLYMIRCHYNSKCGELGETLDQLSECRKKLITATSCLAVMKQSLEQAQRDSVGTCSQLEESKRSLRISNDEISELGKEIRLLKDQLSLVTGKQANAIESFKGSNEFAALLADVRREERRHIYDVEMHELEQYCIKEGFTRGFFKGVRLMRRRTGMNVTDLTLDQASPDPPSPWNEEELSSSYQNRSNSEG